MRIVSINIYEFSELSDKAQKKALTDNRDILGDILGGFDWWDFIYQDAEETALLGISGFNLDHKRISLEFMSDAKSSALSIVSEHGDSMATYSIAKKFLSDLEELERSSEDTDTQELEDDFIEALGGEYLRMLSNEYDYLTSDGALIEYFNDNGHEFTEDGAMWNKRGWGM